MPDQPSLSEFCWFCVAVVVLLAVLVLDAVWTPKMTAEQLGFVKFLLGGIGLGIVGGLLGARAAARR